MVVGNFLFIKGKCKTSRYIKDRIDFALSSVDLLPDVKDKLIDKLTISVILPLLDKEIVTEIDMLTREEGNVELRFHINDIDSGFCVDLKSGKRKISVTSDLIYYLKNSESLEFSIN